MKTRKKRVKAEKPKPAPRIRTVVFFLVYVVTYFLFFTEFPSYADRVYGNPSFPSYMQMLLVYVPVLIWIIIGLLLIAWIVVDMLLSYRVTTSRIEKPKPKLKGSEENEVIVVE